jgi:hypothetical protein
MRVAFRAQHPTFGKADLPLPASYQQRSPYYWWWEFLRRNECYLACCESGGAGKLAGLYADMGDVRHDTFKAWWTAGERGAKLFGEPVLPVTLKELRSPEEWQPEWSKDQLMVVAVPLAVSKRRLAGYFAKLLKKRHKGERGRKSLRDPSTSAAKYPLERNVSVQTLKIQLAVYDAVIASRTVGPKRTLADIGEDLRLVPSAMPKPSDSKSERSDKRNVMAAVVSRYFRQAKAIVDNTAKGKFPTRS